MVALFEHEYIFRNVAMAKTSSYTFVLFWTQKIIIVNIDVSINQMDCILNKSCFFMEKHVFSPPPILMKYSKSKMHMTPSKMVRSKCCKDM